MLHHDPMLNTLHPPRRISEADRYPPQRYKIPVAFRQPVIARSSNQALRAACTHPTVRRQGDLDQRCISAQRAHAYILVDESDKALHPIQDGLKLYLNSCSPSVRSVRCLVNSRLSAQFGDQLFLSHANIRISARRSRRSGGGRSGNPAALAGFPSEGVKSALGLFHGAASSTAPLHPQIVL
jgi:hypothetical protein